MKTALVTGGAKRIGKELCLGLASMGYAIALHYNTTDPAQTVSGVRSTGAACESFRCDLSTEKDVTGLIGRVKKTFPNLQVLINNASIFERSTIKDTGTELFDRHMAINFKAPYILSRDFFRVSEKGLIINIIDAGIMKNSSSYSAYLLSKKALGDFTLMAAREFAPNVRVVGVAPGFILPPEEPSPDYMTRAGEKIPLKRTGDPGDVFNAVKFLIKNTFITGQIIFLDGGENL